MLEESFLHTIPVIMAILLGPAENDRRSVWHNTHTHTSYVQLACVSNTIIGRCLLFCLARACLVLRAHHCDGSGHFVCGGERMARVHNNFARERHFGIAGSVRLPLQGQAKHKVKSDTCKQRQRQRQREDKNDLSPCQCARK